MTELQPRLTLALDLARQAGQLLRQGFGQPIRATRKGEIDLVTEYDLQAEQWITDGIRSHFPDDRISAEESGDRGSGALQWLVDPLDGTTNFAHGVPIFAVSIACTLDLDPLLGVIYDPLRDELFQSTAGEGAWLNGRRLHVSTTRSLDESLLVTGFPYDIRSNPDNNLRHHRAFSLRSRGVRRLGSASIDLAYVAAGRFDAYWEVRSQPWDWAAGVLLVREAGGRVTRLDGGPDIFHPPTSILASNGHLHAAMLEVIDEVGGR
ncbi:MAG TPA: inositol monophosphatase family protein [Anaerolineales bacterium]|nr:inositol monophosphatase family protein [Anaerolineales bacterium]